MDCKEAQKMIPAFLSGELKHRELKQFLAHIEECSECMEELTIQYLVMTGARLLEEGKSVDLGKELERLTMAAHSRIRKRDILTVLSYCLEVVSILAVIIILVMVVF